MKASLAERMALCRKCDEHYRKRLMEETRPFWRRKLEQSRAWNRQHAEALVEEKELDEWEIR